MDVGDFDRKKYHKMAIHNGEAGMYFKNIKFLFDQFRNIPSDNQFSLFMDEYYLKGYINWINNRRKKICAYGDCIKIAGNKKCGGCKQQYYCGRKHQKKDWKKRHRACCAKNN